MREKPFWETKTLEQMDDTEWESLCDGCGRCCLQKLQDEDTDKVFFTRISCALLNTETCRCTHYQDRFNRVADCLSVRPLTEEKIAWLPDTCAYRLIGNGLPLKHWHPLISGTPDSVKAAGISVAGKCVSESCVPIDQYFHHVIDWDDFSAGQ
jgi:uncharacterized cysteine cluster protein YcgN (CxxCxxCC family)